MRKLLVLLAMLLSSLGMNAQFAGGFYEADPNAWFDKEPFFACQNNYVYYGWGQNLQNISVVVNDKDVYSFPYIWEYGSTIILNKDNGFKFSSGDRVSLYCGQNCIGTWKYNSSSSNSLKHLKFKGGGKVLKQAWKYIKKIR